MILEKFIELKSNECAYYRTKVHLMQMNSQIMKKTSEYKRSSSENSSITSQSQSNSIDHRHRTNSVPQQKKVNNSQFIVNNNITFHNRIYHFHLLHEKEKIKIIMKKNFLIRKLIKDFFLFFKFSLFLVLLIIKIFNVMKKIFIQNLHMLY